VGQVAAVPDSAFNQDIQSNFFSIHSDMRVVMTNSTIAGNYFGYYPNKTHAPYNTLVPTREVNIAGASRLTIGTDNDEAFDDMASHLFLKNENT